MVPLAAASLGATGVVAAVVALGSAVPAAAHTPLRETTPSSGAELESAPSVVTATYLQPLAGLEAARVTIDGRERPSGAARLAPADARRVIIPLGADAPAGAYRVTWTVVGADGHALAGELAFRVRPPRVVAVVSRIGAMVARAGRAVHDVAGS